MNPGAVMAYLNAGDQSGAMEMLRQMVPGLWESVHLTESKLLAGG